VGGCVGAWVGRTKGLGEAENTAGYFLEEVNAITEDEEYKDSPKSGVGHWNDRCSRPFEVAACRASGRGHSGPPPPSSPPSVRAGTVLPRTTLPRQAGFE
jgi:hypothetical protein